MAGTDNSQEEMEIGMILENMKQEFPAMPDSMRAMVEREVAKQLKVTSVSGHPKKKGMAHKSVIAALVAAMTLGTTVFAGVTYRMRSSQNGTYGADIGMDAPEGAAAADTQAAAAQTAVAPEEILPVKLEVGYVPEGMVKIEDETGKYCYPDAMYTGGVSMCLYRMDTGDDKFELSFGNVVAREDLTLNGRSGVYLEFDRLFEDEIAFNQRIYVAFTDVHYVLEMFVASDVTKEDAIQMAEGIRLIPADAAEATDCVRAQDWSAYVSDAFSEKEEGGEYAESSPEVIAKDQMKTHDIGESFPVLDYYTEKNEGLSVRVADVAVYDDIHVLDQAVLDSDEREELKQETDANGVLLPAKIDYVKHGDGVETVSEVVDTKEVPQKLVYATVEYTNTGNEAISEVLFFGTLLRAAEQGDQMVIRSETPGEGDAWDEAVANGICHFDEMYYYDVHGGERGNNYIDSIAPGETVTVHMAWFVPETDLPYLYLDLNTGGTGYAFEELSQQMGYVDLRQM